MLQNSKNHDSVAQIRSANHIDLVVGTDRAHRHSPAMRRFLGKRPVYPTLFVRGGLDVKRSEIGGCSTLERSSSGTAPRPHAALLMAAWDPASVGWCRLGMCQSLSS